MKFLFHLLLALFISTSVFSQVTFFADFESGNINTVSTTDSINYTVTTKSDVGGRWFYFGIAGVKNKYISVKVSTTDVNRPMYSYDNINFQRFSPFESPQINVFQKTFLQDTVYVAYYTPYTYSYLQTRISEWKENQFAEVDTVGYSGQNFPMQEIIITDTTVPDENKFRVWIHARTHPGETPSSFHFDGVIQKLLSNDEVIQYYRENIIFHCIPFVNPDGVYFGRSRTNFDGIDLERQWNKPDNQTPAAVLALKNRLTEINNEKVVSVFQNLHSQASSYCTFFIHTPGSTSDYFYSRQYQFANLNASDNPYFFQPDFRESDLQPYFPEGWLWSNHGEEVMALTYETPYDQYSSDIWVTNENLYELGYRLVYSIGEYLKLSHPKHLILDNDDALASGLWNTQSTGLEFFGEDFLWTNAGSGNNTITYNTGTLESGLYDIYGWWTSSSSSAFDVNYKINAGGENFNVIKTQTTNGGQWNFLTEAALSQSGQISITISDSASGLVTADAFRIIYRGPATGIDEEIVPSEFVLYQNYPNPFNPSTTIRFSLTKPAKVQLRVFNALGELVKVLVDNRLGSGQHEVVFDVSALGGQISSGVYYYQLISGEFSVSKGMVLLK
ncbi:MAG: T9SS type A sorting domain-containing protein [Ignavibacteriae bacterium]|nr:T9SS C-terminal target domain-containing protein [Ignavibacteriota bacterium]NOG98996.1 T9SS type A sorting domain-containing protein [Ignavibacteriota bacterium]